MSQLNLMSVGKCAAYAYCSITTIRSLIWLTLQCCYVAILRLYDKQNGDSSSKQEIKNELETMYKWMRIFGLIQRASGPVGVFYYSVAFSVLAIFFAANVFSRGQLFDYLRGNRLASYLENIEIESDRISCKIEMFLDDLISSNKIFTSVMKSSGINIASIDDPSYSQNNHSNNGRFQSRSINRGATLLLSKSNKRNRAIHGSFRGDSYDTEAEINVIRALQRQVNFLIKLKQNKLRIWPPNRNDIWATKIKKLWRTIYMQTFIIYWLIGQSCCFLGCKTALDAISKYKFFGKIGSHIYVSDHFICAETHFMVYWCVYFFIGPLTLVLTSIIDQLEHLSEMNSRMKSARKNLSRSKEWQGSVDPLIRSNYQLLQRAERDLMFECDKDSIELYISFHIFRDEIKANMLVLQSAANQIAAFTIIGLLPILIFIKDIPRNDFAALLIMSSLLIASINTTIVIGAVLHSLCVRLSRQIWSYISLIEELNMYSFNKSQIRKNISDGLGTFSGGLFARHADDTTKLNSSSYIKRNIDFHYYSRSYVSPHSIMLWKRLVERQELIEEDFTCKLFGIFKIDFSGTVRFNYWLISLALIVFTFRKSSDIY